MPERRRWRRAGLIGLALLTLALVAGVGVSIHSVVRVWPASRAHARCAAYFDEPRPMFRTVDGKWAPHADLELLDRKSVV